MKWIKLGIVYKPNQDLWWQKSHAALPTSLHLGGSCYRIFFSSRDKDNRAHVGRFDINLDEPFRKVDASHELVMAPGDWGFFDDHGVQACSIGKADNGDIYLYYLGWNKGSPPPLFYTSLGVAVSTDDGETFQRLSSAPIMQRSRFDPWMVSGGTVIRRGNDWLMYYLSGFKFEIAHPTPVSWYDVKIARSTDGIEWIRDGEIALGLDAGETNISRMTIDAHGGRYRAWFPVKKEGESYRCGYAESDDGLKWQRRTGPELTKSDTGWDSKAVDKMEVIRHQGRLYMLYNGNDFGREGIGLAYADL